MHVLHQQHYAYTLFLRSDQSMRMSMRRGNKLLNKVGIFVFFLRTKSTLVASYNYGWTTGVIWIILAMSLLCFCALIVVVSLLSMEGSEISRVSSKILICVLKINEGLTGLERHEGV